MRISQPSMPIFEPRPQPLGPNADMPSIKVLHLISTFQLGGAELVAYRLAKSVRSVPEGQPDAGQEINHAIAAVWTTESAYQQDFVTACEGAGIRCYQLSQRGRSIGRFSGWLGLPRVVADFRPDVIHSHTDIPDFNLALYLRFLGGRHKAIKVVRTIHNEVLWPTHRLLAKVTESAFSNQQLRNPETIIGISEPTLLAYRSLRQSLGLLACPDQRLIQNPGRGLGQPVDYRDLVAGPLRLLFAGRLTYQKGFDLLIEALLLLPPLVAAQIKLTIYGEGDQVTLLQKLDEGGIPYSYHQPVFDLPNQFRDYHCLLMPSRFEGVPLAVAEAAAVGLPILSGPPQGMVDQLPKDWPYILKPDFEATDLAAMIERMIAHKSQLPSLSAQLLAHSAGQEEQFWTSVDQYAKVYAASQETME